MFVFGVFFFLNISFHYFLDKNNTMVNKLNNQFIILEFSFVFNILVNKLADSFFCLYLFYQLLGINIHIIILHCVLSIRIVWIVELVVLIFYFIVRFYLLIIVERINFILPQNFICFLQNIHLNFKKQNIFAQIEKKHNIFIIYYFSFCRSLHFI